MSTRKTRSFVAGSITLLAASLCWTAPAEAQGAPVGANACVTATMFTHVVTEGNITAHYTVIDHPSTNGNPYAHLIVTPNWTPGGGPLVPNYHPVGVWYNDETGRWNVYNNDAASMSPGTAFNVRVGDGWAVQSPPGSGYIGFGFSYAPSGATFLVTQSYNPGGEVPGGNNWSPLAVWHFNSVWYLTHSTTDPFVEPVWFNVVDEPCAFVHDTTPLNVFGAYTLIDDPIANGNPDAMVIVTRRMGKQMITTPRGPGHLVVHYDASEERWAIRGWDHGGDSMPVDRSLNVLVQALAP